MKDISAGAYTVIVTDSNGCIANGNYIISQPDQPLSIVSQPLPQTDCYGNHVEFSSEITGAVGNVIYQWQERAPGDIFSDITGSNSSILAIDNIGVNQLNVNGTEYRVIITDECTTVTSNSALLNINAIKSITPAIVNSIICSGESITYLVSVQGSVAGYQWHMKNGTNWNAIADGGSYAGATTSQLIISNSTTSQSSSYRVSVTFITLNQPPGYPTCVETSFTRERNLLVRDPFLPPVVSENQQICFGGIPVMLTGTPASGGSGPLYSYQWQKSPEGNSWTDISNETALSYLPASISSTTYYRIAVTDNGTPACDNVFSVPVVITVNPLPSTSVIYHQ